MRKLSTKSVYEYEHTKHIPDNKLSPTDLWKTQPIDTISQQEFLSTSTFVALEVLINMKFPIDKNNNILSISHHMGYSEAYCHLIDKKYYQPNFSECITPLILSYFKKNKINDSTNKIKHMYHLNPIIATNPLSNKYIDDLKLPKYDSILADIHMSKTNINYHRDQLNHQPLIATLVLSLSSLKNNGNIVLTIPGIHTRITRDIVILLSSIFETTIVYRGTCTSQTWNTITIYFNNMNKNPDDIIKKFREISEKLLQLDPSGGLNFAINDPEERKIYMVDEKIDDKAYLINIIDIDYPEKDNRQIYLFNTKILDEHNILLCDIEYYLKNSNNKEVVEYYNNRNVDFAFRFFKSLGIETKKYVSKQNIGKGICENVLRIIHSNDQYTIFNFIKYKINVPTLRITKDKLYPQEVNRLITLKMIGRKIDTRNLELYRKQKYLLRTYERTIGDYIKDNYGITLGDKKVNRGWIKMYEILELTDIIKSFKDKKELNTFHVCEAPGGFVFATLHYAKTKMNFDKLNWTAQSLVNSKIYDSYNQIKDNKSHWDFGADKTGDITSIDNIKHYANTHKNIDMITGDCGVHSSAGEDLYAKIIFSQLVAVLHILSTGGNFVIKSQLMFHNPSYLSLIYFIYLKFEKLIFFKSVQNLFSEEYYVIGINYKETLTTQESKILFDMISDFDLNKSIISLKEFDDRFWHQLRKVVDELTDAFRQTIYMMIYLVDNNHYITEQMKKELRENLVGKDVLWAKRLNFK